MTKTHKKALIIHILDILQKHTDSSPGHHLLQKDIIRILQNDYDMEVDRKAVKRNIDNLIECGFDIDYKKGWYYNHTFEDTELRFLIDSLLFSKLIPSNYRNDIIKKIEGLSSKYFKSRVKHISTLKRPLHANKQLFLTIDVLDEAIGKRKQVTFAYCKYGTNKKLNAILDDSGKIKRSTVNPYQIVATNGRYYLICNYANHDNVVHCRLDRILDIKLSENKRKEITTIEGHESGLDLVRHMDEHIYMFSGESIRVKFKAKKFLIAEIIDWFGETASFEMETDDEVTVWVNVNRAAMLCWALQFGPHVEVLEPSDLRENLRVDIREMYRKYGGGD